MDDLRKVLEVLHRVNEDVNFETESALVDDGLIDSFDILSIINELDEAFAIHIRVADIEPENFNSAASILAMVNTYRG